MIASDLRLPSLSAVKAERARRTMAGFTMWTKPDYIMEPFHFAICKELDQFLADVVAKRSPRLMLFAPPQHGKTELASRRFPAKALGDYPNLRFIATSYNASLASSINRDVQRILDDETYGQLYPKTALFGKNIRTVASSGSWLRNNDIFEIVDHKGFYFSAGVGVGIAGRSADILIMDDPVKDAAEAYSEVTRASIWEWYINVASRRVQSGGGILLIMTRWHEDDPAGRLVTQMKENPLTSQWRIVSYTGLAEQDESFRKKGEALAPHRFTTENLLSAKAEMGPTRFNALFQQRPTAMEGNIFKVQYVQYIFPGSIEKVDQKALSLDAAVKEKETNDFSALLEGWQFDKGILIRSRIHGRMPYPQLREMTKQKAATDQYSALLIEDKSAGQQVIQELQQTTTLPIKPINPGIDKVARAWVIIPAWETNQIWLPCDEDGVPEPWTEHFLAELFSFPNGAHDDQVDAFTQLVNYFTLSPGGRGIISFYQKQIAKSEAEKKAIEAEEAKTHKVEYIQLLGAQRPK